MKQVISDNRVFLMGLAMVGIVIFHHGWVVVPGITAFFYRFGLWGVDLFLCLSGFGCVYALNKYTTSIFFLRRLIRILPTCLLIGLLTFSADLYIKVNRDPAPIWMQLFSLNRWYIQCILICYALSPIAYRINKRYKIYGLLCMVTLCAVAVFFLPNMKPWRLNWIFARIPVFLIGMYIAEYDVKITRTFIIVSSVILIAAIVTRCWGGYYVFQWPIFLAFASPFICLILSRMKQVLIKLHLLSIIKSIGLYSLEIYLIHVYAYWMLTPLNFPLWVKYLWFTIVVVLFSIASKYITTKIAKQCQSHG